jgi:hypothetical protein
MNRSRTEKGKPSSTSKLFFFEDAESKPAKNINIRQIMCEVDKREDKNK